MSRRSIDVLLAAARGGVDRPTPAELAAAPDVVVVDIRPVEDRKAEGILPGAWIIDRNVLEWRLDPASPHRLAAVDDDLYDRRIVLLCNEGYASSLAAATLRLLGLQGATDLDGGFRAWRSAGLPVAAGPGTPAGPLVSG